MTITGLALAKGILLSVGAAGIAIAAIHAGNAQGISTALSHAPAWTQGHTVLRHLA